jgi:hypothetical protein
MLSPPAALTFGLEGTERHLSFAYGFNAGAYTSPGATNGAVYQVELQRDGAPSRVIFERRLDPVAEPDHRGRQFADLVLPAGLRAGDRLVVRIDAAGNDSWDWTYLAALDLR